MDSSQILVRVTCVHSASKLTNMARLYMLDATYQSVMCFFMTYLFFSYGHFATDNGLGVDDKERMGVYVACATVTVVNVYILLNSYRWDWLMLTLVAFSILLVWFWTGVYSSFTSSQYYFYKAGAEIYGQLSFWVVSLLTIIVCLLPRFTIKSFQKIFFPYDVDIIREQVRQGKFRYLDDADPANVPATASKAPAMSDVNGSGIGYDRNPQRSGTFDDTRPFYPPSIARTNTTNNGHSHAGSDGTDSTGHRLSLEQPPQRTSFDRPRPSFDRIRLSMGEVRPSFEQSRDFTSAAYLSRVESSHSGNFPTRTNHGASSLR